MKIEYLQLKGYKRFKLANIAEFELNVNNDITVITATNGYGKSSLLRELTPLPPVRTDFEKDGNKKLKIRHEGHDYVLSSDFTNRTSPHSFIRDNEELNVSGTTDVQEELCEKYFGITSIIRNILFGKTKICNMTKAERKNLFLSVNPMDLTLILESFKKAQYLNRKCKNNLQHLYARKADIESKLIDKELLDQHEVTCEKYRNIVSETELAINELRQHVAYLGETYKREMEVFSQCRQDDFVHKTKATIKDIRPHLISYSDISRDDAEYHKQYTDVISDISSMTARRDTLVEQIRTLSTEVEECKKYLENAVERPITKIEEELTQLYAEIKKLGDFTNFTTIAEHDLQRYDGIYNEINELILNMASWDVTFISPVEASTLARQLEDVGRNLISLNSERTTIVSRMDAITKQLENNTANAKIPTDCGHDSCGLKTIFQSQNSGLELERNDLSKKLLALDGKIATVTKQHEELQNACAKFLAVDYIKHYDRLSGLLYRYFNAVDDWNNNLLNLLKGNPTDITIKLQHYLSRCKDFIRYNTLMSEKNKLEAELKVSTEANATSTEFVRNKLNQATTNIDKNMEALKVIGESISELCATRDRYHQYVEDIRKVKQLDEYAQQYAIGCEASASCEYWRKVGNELLRVRSDFKAKEAELLRIVKEQTTLRASYQTEVVDQIKIYEADQKKYTAIEAALSPTSGLAHKSMLKYLNAVISNVNYFIAQIWSYPMRLIPYAEDQAIDYGFKIEVGNDLIPDINQLSDGQTEVINLAFILTILLQLRMLDKVPFFADEIGRTFDSVHRMQILKFLGRMVDEHMIEQLFLVNHFALFTDGFTSADVICLSPDTMTDLPRNTNQCVTIKH